MKQFLAMVLSLLLLLSVTACGNSGKPEPVPSGEGEDGSVVSSDSGTQTAPHPAPSDTPELPPLEGDSYWVAYESEGDIRESVPESERLLTDLTLWADGTARIREIEDGIWLVSGEDEQNMTWTYEANGTLKLYTPYSGDMPYWTGKRTADGIELERFGGTYRFREETMPEGGNLYSPAELQGVWLQIGTEVEGYMDMSLPGYFASLIFHTEQGENGKRLPASSATVNYGSFDPDRSYTDRDITLLDQPIYEGCGNDEWSVRIGEESPLNQHGYPLGVDLYVTLLDQNTLLQQQYYSFDNGSIPGVSYQTYRRFLPDAPYDLEKADLEGGSFELTGYIDADGLRHDTHPTYSDFGLYLDASGSYMFAFEDSAGEEYTGGGSVWHMGNGGTLQLWNDDTEEDCWAGAVTVWNGIPEIFLWDNAEGIMVLERTEGDSKWDGYADTMNDLEGNAFAAPENTLCVLYNHGYTDWSAYPSVPLYEIDDDPQAQYLLITSVEDGSYFWLEEDGYCREDFGTVDAGESLLIRLNIPESGGMNLQVGTSLGEYFIELIQGGLVFDENWTYLTT